MRCSCATVTTAAPFVRQWGTERHFKEAIWGVAVSGGEVFVCDGHNRISLMTSSPTHWEKNQRCSLRACCLFLQSPLLT